MGMRHYNRFFDYNVAALYLAWTEHSVGVSLMCVIERKHGYWIQIRNIRQCMYVGKQVNITVIDNGDHLFVTFQC